MDADFQVKVSQSFVRFVGIVAHLRDPHSGCPWDLKQDHRSLRRFMLEEAYEAADAMGKDDYGHIIEELGDVLLQVVLNSQLLLDARQGSIIDVINSISEKMIRRHPHVFDPDFGRKSVDEVKRNWQQIKAAEKPLKSAGAFAQLETSPLPALMHGVKIGKVAGSVNFDWSHPQQVLEKVKEELHELEQEMVGEGHEALLTEELGDLLFSIAQLARHLGIDPEVAAAQGNQKFLQRFAALEDLARTAGKPLEELSQEDMEALWVEVKKHKKGFL